MKQTIKAILLLLLSPSTSHVYAQLQGQAKLDSLIKELPRQKEDTNKVNMLNALSFGYGDINPDEGIKYGQQALSLATKLEWKKGIAQDYNVLGLNYSNKSDKAKALEYYFKALKLREEIGDKKGIASTTGNIGNVYGNQSDYPKALEYYFKALTLYEELGIKTGIASTTGNIGTVYQDKSDYPKALEYYFKSLKLYEELGDKTYIASTTGNIGGIYICQKDYPKALEYLFKALKLSEELGYKINIASTTSNIGALYQEQRNYIMAVEYYERALKLCEELGNKDGKAVNLMNIGRVYLSIVKDTSSKGNKVIISPEILEHKYQPAIFIPRGKAALLLGAIDYTQRALAISKENNTLADMQECYSGLSEAYKLKGNYKLAMQYGDSIKIINDSIYSRANREKISKLEDARKEFADSLKAANENRAREIKATQRRNYELIGAGVLALAIGFIFLLRKNIKLLGKEKKRSDNLLLNILPEEVATQLKDTGSAAARNFDNVTVLFTDFVNFTEASGRMTPEALIEELDTCFKKFDAITGKHSVEKIKTIGDAYLAVCGLPHPNPNHAENIVKAAQEIAAFMQDREAKLGNSTFQIRIGIHTGSVIAGIVGDKKFAYDIWGDTVNTAARMEQNSVAGKINISQTTYELIKDKIPCEYRGEIDAKGKGVMKMYYVLSKAAELVQRAVSAS